MMKIPAKGTQNKPNHHAHSNRQLAGDHENPRLRNSFAQDDEVAGLEFAVLEHRKNHKRSHQAHIGQVEDKVKPTVEQNRCRKMCQQLSQVFNCCRSKSGNKKDDLKKLSTANQSDKQGNNQDEKKEHATRQRPKRKKMEKKESNAALAVMNNKNMEAEGVEICRLCNREQPLYFYQQEDIIKRMPERSMTRLLLQMK